MGLNMMQAVQIMEEQFSIPELTLANCKTLVLDDVDYMTLGNYGCQCFNFKFLNGDRYRIVFTVSDSSGLRLHAELQKLGFWGGYDLLKSGYIPSTYPWYEDAIAAFEKYWIVR